jgi:hypothetical protein
LAISKQSYTNESIEHFIQDNKVLILGSGWDKDYELLKEVIAGTLLGDMKIIIAPHNVNENELLSIEKLFNNSTNVDFRNILTKHYALLSC